MRDLLERLFWTVVAAALTNLGTIGLLDIEAWKAAALAGINGAVTFVLVVARQRLAVLPDPGEGLPGLPTGDGGYVDAVSAVLILVLLLVVLRIFGLI